MPETSVTDPTFGKLIYDGTHHRGWGGSFIDARFMGWGVALDKHFADFDEGEPVRTSAASFAADLLAIAGPLSGEAADAAEKMLAAARRTDAYDGMLDAGPLRKAGRFKIVVRNLKDEPPTPQQQTAWRAFLDGGDALAEQIAERLLTIYLQHRPELLRWWASIYGDSPDRFFPEATSTRAMRDIVRPNEFRVYLDQDGDGVTVGIQFESLWVDGTIDLRIRDGQIFFVRPEPTGLRISFTPKRYDVPPFGPMRWRECDGWIGQFQSDGLRGFLQASQERHRFATAPRALDSIHRPMPPWDVITGDFELQVRDNEGNGPTSTQADAYRAFTANQQQNERLILAAILNWYQEMRPELAESMDAEPEEIVAAFPEIDSPEGLLEIIQLQTVHVLADSEDEEKSVAIGLTFAWEDEHGLGVRWRNGQVEAVGDAEVVEEE